MLNLYETLLSDQNEEDNDIYLNILNDMHGHLDFNDMCKYHDLTAYDKLSETDSHQLNILHLNSLSLSNKIDSIASIFQTLKRSPDILCVTETWLQEPSKDLCSLGGFRAFHLCRTTRSHGGVSVFVANNLQVDQVENLTFITNEIEINTVKVNIGDSSYTICTIYRPDNKYTNIDSFTNKLSDIIS